MCNVGLIKDSVFEVRWVIGLFICAGSLLRMCTGAPCTSSPLLTEVNLDFVLF